jgi:endonuclease YncB( thermonuclease family)
MKKLKNIFKWVPVRVQEVLDGDTFKATWGKFVGFEIGKPLKNGYSSVQAKTVDLPLPALTVRLRNIDAPELKQPFGAESMAYLQSILPVGKVVWGRLQGKESKIGDWTFQSFQGGTDKYGRYLMDISFKPENLLFPYQHENTQESILHLNNWFFSFESGEAIDEIMVGKGFAWHYLKYTEKPLLALAERQARSAKLGLWSLPEEVQIAPWDFRKLVRGV